MKNSVPAPKTLFTLTAVSLFWAAGGMDLGLQKAGFRLPPSQQENLTRKAAAK